jgi:sugar/nucleoside kinase (ribokinase family)
MFVIIGTTTADLFIFSEHPFNNPEGDGFTAGNLVFCDDPPKMLIGGNGGCSAYVLAGLGVPTALCSAVGRDHLGERLIGWLKARNVNLEAVFHSETLATSTSTIIMSDAAHQVVFHHPGATRDIRPDIIPQNLISEAEVLLATSYSLIPAMRAGGFQQALATVHKAGGICAADIGPAIGDPVFLKELQPLLPTLDYLIANIHELSVLTQTADWEESSSRLIAAGAKCIVIKRGEYGASVRGPDIELNVPGFKVKSRISVGAGDAFNVGFLSGIQQRWSLKRAVRFANALAALIVSSAEGVLDAPTMAQVDAFLAK